MAVAQDSTVADLPDVVRRALLGMPHTNQRKTVKKWYEYYDQRTLDLVYEMYSEDFTVFEYSPVLEQRPDLKEPHSYSVEQEHLEHLSRDSWSSSDHGGRREIFEKSTKSPVSHVTIRRHFASSMSPATRLFDLEEGDKEYDSSNPPSPERPRKLYDDADADIENLKDDGAVITPDSSTTQTASFDT